MPPFLTWPLTALACVILLVLGALLDGPSDIEAEAATAAALADARAHARAEHALRERCATLASPDADAAWRDASGQPCLSRARVVAGVL